MPKIRETKYTFVITTQVLELYIGGKYFYRGENTS